MRLSTKINLWLTDANKAGRLLRVARAARALRSLYHFHSVARFTNAWQYRSRRRAGKWVPLGLDQSILQRVFYVVEDRTNTDLIIKIPRGDNQFSSGLIKTLADKKQLNEYRATLLSGSLDPLIGRHLPEVLEVRPDGGYISRRVDGANLAQLRFAILSGQPGQDLIDVPGFQAAVEELIANLKRLLSSGRELVGDWALHNLIYEKNKRRIVNVDVEGLYSFKGQSIENEFTFIESNLCNLSTLVRLAASRIPKESHLLSVVRIVSDVYRTSGTVYNGQQFIIGYHSIDIGGTYFRGQRDCVLRLQSIPFNFQGKTVLDLGCNVGGMLHALSRTVAHGFGFDHNPKCINAAHSIAAINDSRNLSFFYFDLDGGELSRLTDLTIGHRVDICFLLSVCMWLKDWKAVVEAAARLSDALLFESNGTAEQQEDQLRYIRSCYREVTSINEKSGDDPLQRDRKLYICRGSIAHAQTNSPQNFVRCDA